MGDAQETRCMADAGLGGISSVVSSLPAGYTLGEARYLGATKYRLVHNAGNSQVNPGFGMTPVLSAGAYSLTISSASKVNAHIGAAFVVHATITTGAYGWAAIGGPIGGVVADATSIPTGSAFYLAANGQVEHMPQSVVTGNMIIGVNLGGSASKTVTTGTKSGDVLLRGLDT